MDHQPEPAGHATSPDGPGGVGHRVPRGPRGHALAAWIVVTLLVVAKIMLPTLLPAAEDETLVPGDPVGELLVGIQGRYMVGAAELTGGGPALYAQGGQLDVGSLGQRQRFVVLAGELAGRDAARRELDELEADLAEAGRDDTPPARRRILTPEEASLQRRLGVLFPPGSGPETSSVGDVAGEGEAVSEAVSGPDLDDAARAELRSGLGWFGDLALAPAGSDDAAARAAVLAAAKRTFVLVISIFVAAGVAGLAGFVGLVLLVVLALLHKLSGGLAPGGSPHGIYAETFAIWLAAFIGLQLVVGVIAPYAAGAEILVYAGAFFVSLLTLAWPVWRGIAWTDVRRDIGWTAGRHPVAEAGLGVCGYAMGLPILAVGLALTFVCLLVDAALAGPAVPFAPASGPAHPIVAQLGSGDAWLLTQILLLGAVAAPIVEETMFRGVLYRHLRDASRRLGVVVSILVGAGLNAFVFAIIHPQGWVAVPALMSLAIAFSLAREWRVTLIPSMLMHGISNAIVLGMIATLASF